MALEDTRAARNAGAAPRSLFARIPDPPLFSGKDRKALRPFVMQLRLKIAEDAERMPTEQSRLRYAFSRLEGIALAQVLPHVQDTHINLANVAAVIQLLEEAFGDPDRVATAFRELAALRQKDREFSLYLADFQRIAADLTLGEQSKIEHLRSGLSNELKDTLTGVLEVPEDYAGFVRACQKLDNKLCARRREKRGEDHRPPRTANMSTPPPTPTQTPATAPAHATASNSGYYGPAPMDLSAVRYRLTADEKRKRFDQGLCMYCGGSGHFASNCPNKAKGRPLHAHGVYTPFPTSPSPSPAPAPGKV